MNTEANQKYQIKGNRCGHNKLAPVLTPVDFSLPDDLPAVLKEAIAKAQDFYYQPEMLNDVRFGRYSPSRKKLNKSPFTDRRIRSEMREAISRVMVLLLQYTDLASCRFGMPLVATREFLVFDLHWMADRTGMSYDRACRAVAHLKRAGFLSVRQRLETTVDDFGAVVEFRSKTAIRVVQEKLFAALKISKRRLKKARDIAAAKLKKLCNHGGLKRKVYREMHGKKGRLGQNSRVYQDRVKKRRPLHDTIMKLRDQHWTEDLYNLTYEEQENIVNHRIVNSLTGGRLKKR